MTSASDTPRRGKQMRGNKEFVGSFIADTTYERDFSLYFLLVPVARLQCLSEGRARRLAKCCEIARRACQIELRRSTAWKRLYRTV